MKKLLTLFTLSVMGMGAFAQEASNYNIRVYMPPITNPIAQYADSVCVVGDFNDGVPQLMTAQQDDKGDTYYAIQLNNVESGATLGIRLGKVENQYRLYCGDKLVPDIKLTDNTDVVLQYRYGCYVYGCQKAAPYVKTTWEEIAPMVKGLYTTGSKLTSLNNVLVTDTTIFTYDVRLTKKPVVDSVFISYDTIYVYYNRYSEAHLFHFPYYGYTHANKFVDLEHKKSYSLFSENILPHTDIIDMLKGNYVSASGQDSLKVHYDEEISAWRVYFGYYIEEAFIHGDVLISGYLNDAEQNNVINLIARYQNFVFTMNGQKVESVSWNKYTFFPAQTTALESLTSDKQQMPCTKKVMKGNRVMIIRGNKIYNVLGAQL